MEDTKKYHKYFTPETISSLNNLWDEIGYSEEEKKIRLHQLVQRIQNVHTDFIDETLKKCQNLTRKTNEIKDKHIKKLEALGASEQDIEHVKETEILGTIKDKYIDASNRYEDFLNIYNQRVDEFKKYYIQIQSCFKEIGAIETIPQCCNKEENINENENENLEEEETKNENETKNDNLEKTEDNSNEQFEESNIKLENDNVKERDYKVNSSQDDDINDQNKTHVVSGYENNDNAQVQGEFAQIGEEDLTYDRLKRFEDKANELQKEVDIRSRVFNEIKSKIIKLQSDLCEVSPPEIEEMLNGQVYSDYVCDRLTDYQNYLTELFETRRKYISEMAIEIVKLWDLLDVDEDTRSTFLATHSLFSQKNVQDCIDEAEKLTKIRNDKLPEIIEKMKKEISNICDDLGYSEEQKQQIYQKCDDYQKSDAGNENENEMAHDIQFYNENKDNFIQFDENKNEEEEEEEEHLDDEENEMKKTDNDEDIIIEEEEEDKGDEIPTPQFEENVEETKNFIKIFNNYEAELLRLRKIHLVAQPIIDLIKQRQEIIDEYNNLMEKKKQNEENSNKQKASDKNKIKDKDMVKSAPVKKKKKEDKQKRADELNGKVELKTIRVRPPNAQDKIYQEKVIRRHKTILPRVEKKLLITLIQFREENGEDFIWKQKPIINELKDIPVTQSEIRAQSKSRSSMSNQSRKKSITATNTNSNTTSKSKQRKSLQPSKQNLDVDSKRKRNQRKSTIPRNPNI